MGLFDKLKLSVGIGGAKVEVKLNPGPVPLGGFAKGQVILHGGKVEQKCNALTVTLKRSKVVRVEVEGKLQDQTQTDNLHQDDLAAYEQTIHPGSDSYYDFAMQIPNEGGEESRISYEIVASADIPGAIDPSASVKIPLGKAAEMTIAQVPQMLGVADQLRNQGNKEAELEGVLAQVLSVDANNTRALRMMAEVMDYRSPAEAAQKWKAFVALVPEDVDAWSRLAQNAERRGAFDEALQHSAKTVELAPGKTEVWLTRANIFEQKQGWSDAVSCYEKALAGDNPYTRIHVQKANALLKQDKKEDAVAALTVAGKAGDAYCLSEILDALDAAGRPEFEEEMIIEAIKQNADSYYPWQTKAERLMKRNAAAQAVTAIETALTKDVSSDWARGQLWFMKGKAFESLNKNAEAKTAYAKAVEEYKEHREAKDRLKALK